MPQERIRAARRAVKPFSRHIPFTPTQRHHPACRLFISANCSVAITCPHGYDVCPTCDPCTCDREYAADVRHAIIVHFHDNA
jgi:hypothetical protein